MLDNLWSAIADVIAEKIHQPFALRSITPVSGGDINENFLLSGEEQNYFVKINRHHPQLFPAEAMALERIRSTGTIRVPEVVAQGVAEQVAYLVLEALHLSSAQGDSQLRLGQQLANLHRAAPPQDWKGRFGWPNENFIGHSPQQNNPTRSWAEFWRENRLRPQLATAYANGFADDLQPYERDLLSRSDELLAEHDPTPSLVHGDLWAGNASVLRDGTPVIFDPASYYGDREVDLAMTELFGGFGAGFYQGYASVWPLDAQYEQRKPLYNLYHMLNHLNLFGAGYRSSCTSLTRKLLKKL